MNGIQKIVAIGLFGAGSALMSGCATSSGGISASSTPLEGRSYDVLGATRGTDSAVRLLGLIPISGQNSISDAVNDAEKSVNADALIEVTVENYYHYYILFSRNVTAVEGLGIRFKGNN